MKNTEDLPLYESIERDRVLGAIKAAAGSDGTFEELVSAAQKISIELFLNQSAIVLWQQTEFMARRRALLPIEDFRIWNITSDIMRELLAYDIGINENKAFEFLDRQGYTITHDSE